MGYPVSSDYGPRTVDGQQNFHTGIDFATPCGTVVHATTDGVARITKTSQGYGWYLTITQGSLTVLYGHLQGFKVADRARVRQGQPVAVTGGDAGHPGAGWSTGCHLHYEERVDGAHRRPRLHDRLWEADMFTANEEKFLKNFIKKCEELGIGPFDAARASQVIQTHKANHSTVPAGDHSHSAKVVLD